MRDLADDSQKRAIMSAAGRARALEMQWAGFYSRLSFGLRAVTESQFALRRARPRCGMHISCIVETSRQRHHQHLNRIVGHSRGLSAVLRLCRRTGLRVSKLRTVDTTDPAGISIVTGAALGWASVPHFSVEFLRCFVAIWRKCRSSPCRRGAHRLYGPCRADRFRHS